ncbi:hypothetical protein LC612_42000 [Nostoc sp. CHAB 5834]|nr:hypothetical protein [Nostoc sp. CHAB 5834]
MYWQPLEPFVDELAHHLRGARVLEIFAGNGLLAGLLQSKGIAVTPTTRFAGHDSHERGLYSDVREMTALNAVQELGPDNDVLLVCWPTATPATLIAAMAWGSNKDIVFIGEQSDPSQGLYGGCACDDFFKSIHITKRFESYKGNFLEAAFVCRLIEI